MGHTGRTGRILPLFLMLKVELMTVEAAKRVVVRGLVCYVMK